MALYDSFGNIVGVTQGSTTPSNLGTGQTTLFNLQLKPIVLIVIPKSYRIGVCMLDSAGFICKLNMVVKFLEFSNLYLVGDNIIVHQLVDALDAAFTSAVYCSNLIKQQV